MQKEVIIGMVITIVLLLLVIIWAIFVRKEKYDDGSQLLELLEPNMLINPRKELNAIYLENISESDKIYFVTQVIHLVGKMIDQINSDKNISESDKNYLVKYYQLTLAKIKIISDNNLPVGVKSSLSKGTDQQLAAISGNIFKIVNRYQKLPESQRPEWLRPIINMRPRSDYIINTGRIDDYISHNPQNYAENYSIPYENNWRYSEEDSCKYIGGCGGKDKWFD